MFVGISLSNHRRALSFGTFLYLVFVPYPPADRFPPREVNEQDKHIISVALLQRNDDK